MQVLITAAMWLSLHAIAPSQILLTELQPVPAAGEPEWIEVENLGGQNVRLSEWMLCDARSCVRIPASAMARGMKQESTVPARGRLVLTRDAEALLETRTIPDHVPVIEFALPSLNNSTESVFLRDEDSSLVDSMSYNMKKHVKGRSVERTGSEVSNKVVYDELWASNLSVDSASCGLLNSQVRLPRDRRIAGIYVYDADIGIGVVNHGLEALPGTTLFCRGSGGGPDLDTTTSGLRPGEHFEWRIPLASLGWPARQGALDLHFYVREHDDRATNDTLHVTLNLPPPAGMVTLTEIMYDPWPDMRDYVEIANRTSDTIQLTGWMVEDAAGLRCTVSTLSTLAPQGYGVVSSADDVRGMMPTGLPAICNPILDLNASGDRVALRSPAGFLVDEVWYKPEWHQPELPSSKGVSLEKLDVMLSSNASTSWTSSGALQGGTPGAPNSVRATVVATFDLHAVPSPFSSDRTSPIHPTVIGYSQPFRHAIASLSIREPDGTLVRALLNGSFTGASGAVAWDGCDHEGRRVRPGPYVAVLECVDAASANTHRAVCMIVVGE